MAKKDKFQRLKEGGGVSFDDLARQATTLAAIERQTVIVTTPQTDGDTQPKANPVKQPEGTQGGVVSNPADTKPPAKQRMTHLPNPSISVRDYNLATQYCYQHDNMTRLDWMERAIINQLNRDGLITDEELASRLQEIQSRPPRGMRKNTKIQ